MSRLRLCQNGHYPKEIKPLRIEGDVYKETVKLDGHTVYVCPECGALFLGEHNMYR